MTTLVRRFLGQVDQLLRGDALDPDRLRVGEIDLPARSLIVTSLVLGAIYGALMGLFAIGDRGVEGLQQLLSCIIKVPLLFLLTLVVTFPSLYVFSALGRSRLGFHSCLRLLLGAIAVNLAVLASFGPVTAFFTVSTSSYPFILLLNVVFFAIAGFVGLGFVRKVLGIAMSRSRPETQPDDQLGPPPPPPPPRVEHVEDSTRRVFQLWLVIYGVVGAQMGWILRPFVGDPALPFQLLRERHSNFFAAVIECVKSLFS